MSENAADATRDRGPRTGARSVELPDLSPRRTRQQWTRSALVAMGPGGTRDDAPDFVLGTGNGIVRAFAADGDELWTADLGGMIVALEPAVVEGVPVVLVGTRGETAILALLDATRGDPRWTYDLEADLGSATKETLFYYPMAVDLASNTRTAADGAPISTDSGRFYAAARRYERSDGDRLFRSRVYAFDTDGEAAWTRESDASPIALSRRDDRLAVAYNRCHGDHQCGLVVLDAETGDSRLTWDPGTGGGRRVGDVALDEHGAVLASHGDYRGYALDKRGRERWRVDLGRPVEGETDAVYAYPNRVVLDGDRALFVTGNTFPDEGRDTDDRHPREHSLIAVEGGDVAWTTSVKGWVGGVAVGDEIAVAVAQHFRDRRPESHALRRVDADTGEASAVGLAGVATAVARGGNVTAVLEEPIAYHDEEAARGTHALHIVENA